MINGVECNFYRMLFEIKHFKIDVTFDNSVICKTKKPLKTSHIIRITKSKTYPIYLGIIGNQLFTSRTVEGD